MSARKTNTNPYDEQNARVVGHRFITENVANTSLPGIPSAAGKFYIPLDMIPHRSYKDDNDGWTKVVNKKKGRRNGGWIGRTD